MNLSGFIKQRLDDVQNNARAVGNTVHRDVVAPVAHAAGNIQHAAGNVVNAGATTARDTGGAIAATNRFLKTPGIGVERSLVGTAQGLSGLYDLATPGRGTNRLSQGLNRSALSLDKQGAAGMHPNLYKPGQLIGDLATFNVAAKAAKGAGVITKALPGANKAASITSKVSAPVTKLTTKLAEGNLPSRLAGAGLHGVTSQLPANAAFTALQTGANASKGRATTPGNIGLGLADGTALSGLTPIAGQLGKEGINGARTGARVVSGTVMGKPAPHVTDQELAAANRVSMTRNGFPDNTKPGDIEAYRKVQKKLGVKDVNDTKAVDDLIGARMTYQNRTPLQNMTGGRVNLAPLNSTGKALVSEDGSVIPTVKKLAGKSTKQEPQLPTTPQTKTALPAKPAILGGSDALPQNTPKVAPNALSAKVEKQNLSPETAAQVSGDHTVRNTTNLADEGAKAVDALPTETAIEHAHNSLAQPLGHVNDEQTAFIAKTIEKADAEATKARQAGDTLTADRLSREAATLHDGLSEHATARGQANQALTMMYNRSPQGLFYSAMRDLKKAGVKDTPELRARLQAHADAIKTAKEGADKTDALGKFHQAVSKEMPQNIGDKAIGIWKAGLLSGVKTQEGNFLSNGVFKVLKKISDVPAVAVDKAISLGTKKRTIALTGKGELSGTVEGVKNAGHTLKTGIDRRGAGDKYEQHAEIDFKNPYIDKTIGRAVRGVFRGMNAADQPVWYGTFKNSMYDQAKAAGITKGLRGKDLSNFMAESVKNPSTGMLNTALKDANKSTLNYDTIGSKIVQQAHKGIDNAPGTTPKGAQIAHGVLNVIAPFVRVPSAFLSRTVDFTPLGVGKEIFHQVASGKFDQRALSQAVGEGLTGTGAIALGIALTQHNLYSGDYPKNDVKEQQRWKAEGITPNSIKIGGKWVSANYLGPLGILFNVGQKIENAKGENEVAKAGTALGGLGQGLLGQSFLQGMSGFINATQDPGRYAGNLVNSQVGSLIPSLVNDVGNATDKLSRQVNNPLDAIKNRIPGVRHGLDPKQDVYGNNTPNPNAGFNAVNGLKPSASLTNRNPVINEVNRLHSVDPNNSDLQVTPTPVGRSITMPAPAKGQNGATINLSDKQRYALQKQIGQTTQDNWSKFIKTPEYQAMTDTEKAKKLTAMRQDSTELATRKYVVDNNLGAYNKPASKAAVALSEGDMSKYTSAADGTTGTPIAKNLDSTSKTFLTKYNNMTADDRTKAANNDPAFEYNYAQAKYANDKANGKLSTAQDISAKDGIAKAKVGADYTKNVRDLYGLSKSDLDSYLSTEEKGVDKQKIANDLFAYDKALKDAKINTSLKFKYGFGTKTGGSTASSRKAAKFKTVSIPSVKNNPYKSGSKQKFKQVAMPKFSKASHASYKTAKLSTSLNAKLRKA